MPRLRRDDDSRSTARDDSAERFEHQCGPVQIDFENCGRRRLCRRDPRSVNQASDVTDLRGHLPERVHEGAEALARFALLNHSGTIALLYVAPQFRFCGVSKALLASLEEHAMALG